MLKFAMYNISLYRFYIRLYLFLVIVNQGGRDYGRNHPLIPPEGRYVFMSVDCSRETPEIKYQIIDRESSSCQVTRLTAAGTVFNAN